MDAHFSTITCARVVLNVSTILLYYKSNYVSREIMVQRQISQVLIVPYLAEQMYDLVADIDSYPEFIPHCVQASRRVIKKNSITGQLVFSWMGVHFTLVTHNVCCPPSSIELELVKGPLHDLQGTWRFTPLPHNRCEVSFMVNLTLHSWQSFILVPSMLELMPKTVVQVFVNRAKYLHG